MLVLENICQAFFEALHLCYTSLCINSSHEEKRSTVFFLLKTNNMNM